MASPTGLMAKLLPCVIVIATAYAETGYNCSYLNVLDFGAHGDGVTDDASAITAAIQYSAAQCSAGGRVVLPTAHTFLSSPLWLASNLDFHVEAGATLLANPDFSMWPMVWKGQGFGYSVVGFLNGGRCVLNSSACTAHSNWRSLTNVSVSGGGVIDGQGFVWWQAKSWWPTLPQPWMLDFHHVDGLAITGVTLFRSAYWTVNPSLCRNVMIAGITLDAGVDRAAWLPYSGYNVDGIDSNNVINMTVKDSVLHAGDDCIALNSRNVGPEDWPSRGILITNISCVTPISLGSGTGNGVFDVVIKDSTVDGRGGNHSMAWLPKWWKTGLRFKTARGRGGGGIANVTISNLTFFGLDLAVDFQSYYSCQNSSGTKNCMLCRNATQAPVQPPELTPTFSNITITGLRGDAWRAAWLNCLPEKPCTGIYFDDVQLSTQQPEWVCEHVHGSTGPSVSPPATGCLQSPQ